MSGEQLLSAQPRVEISGTLDKILFCNPENGYTVLRLKPHNKADFITAVGILPPLQPGGGVKLCGDWVNHPRFGRQLQVQSCENLLPATAEGIIHYLGSGMIKGVRGGLARRIVSRFKEDTFRVLDEEPDRLLEVSGLGVKVVDSIKTAWDEHKSIRDLIMFLQPHGISTAYAVRIFRHYGGDSLSIVRENPYRLAMDIHGIGFLSADEAARKLGFERDSPLRAQAGILYMLKRTNDDGHVYYPLPDLVELTSQELDIDPSLAEEAVFVLQADGRVVVEELADQDGLEHQAVYLSLYHHYESKISFYLQRLLRSPKTVRFEAPESALAEGLAKSPLELAGEQVEAVEASLTGKVLVVTGGPGTGKTTVINTIIKVFQTRKAKILLAAPTGRAAKRMSETSGLESKTIHRLLEYSPAEDGFARNEDNPLACGLLVVDEASMMDTMLMYHLLKAVPLGATLILVGDVNQLPSVGPGNVLRDVIASGVVPVVELVEIFRQAAESEIIINAHRINHGEMPETGQKEGLSDFYFIRQEDPDKAADLIVDLVKNHIPRRFRLHPVDDIQVLTPMHKGSAGAQALNAKLQAALNGQTLKLQRGDRAFRLDDKVMQIRNNYEKDVFNGDIGRICHVNSEDRELTVRFEDKNVIYSSEELDEIVPAYAISIHKSQGSEYPAVVLPILTQHYVLLQRNLLYTAVTRGKKLVIIVGSPRALAMAVKNNQMRRRHTWLAQRLGGI